MDRPIGEIGCFEAVSLDVVTSGCWLVLAGQFDLAERGG